MQSETLVTVFECNDCGKRYPLMPYYPVAAPHGPKRDCRAPSGWTPVRESYPPRSRAAVSQEQRNSCED